MEPLKRVIVSPSDLELRDLLHRYPGWLTAIAEGTIENPERPATEKELLVSHYQRVADEMGVYSQEGMPSRRYLKDYLGQPSVEFLNELRPVIDQRDDTSFEVLTHMVSRMVDDTPIADEVREALKYQKQLGISYFDAAALVRSFSVYAAGVDGVTVPDPRKDSSSLKVHLAITRAVKAVQEVYPDALWVVPKWGIQYSPASLINASETMMICDPYLLSLVIDHADHIEVICRLMVERSVIRGKELRPLAETVIESLRSGASPSLATGTL